MTADQEKTFNDCRLPEDAGAVNEDRRDRRILEDTQGDPAEDIHIRLEISFLEAIGLIAVLGTIMTYTIRVLREIIR